MTATTILAQGDRDVGSTRSDWRTLDPSREVASTLSAIGAVVLPADLDSDPRGLEFARGLTSIARAMREAFPDNLLWDLDYLAASLWRHAGGEVLQLATHAAAIVAVQRVFGRRTAIGFAYVHDFVYGYDWAKWVAKAPATRAAVAPFSPQFVAVMQARGDELLHVIETEADEKYPPLPDARPRNPFGFSREPADELALHRALARQGAVPVAAWDVHAQPDPTRSYAAMRRQTAAGLGLSR